MYQCLFLLEFCLIVLTLKNWAEFILLLEELLGMLLLYRICLILIAVYFSKGILLTRYELLLLKILLILRFGKTIRVQIWPSSWRSNVIVINLIFSYIWHFFIFARLGVSFFDNFNVAHAFFLWTSPKNLVS